MKLFKRKTIDEKFLDLGYELVKETDSSATYSKYIEAHKYNHCIYLGRRANGDRLIHSYDDNIKDKENFFTYSVGLSCELSKLSILKMKELSKKYKW